MLKKLALTFRKGEPLRSADLNALVSKVNEVIECINGILRGQCNLNLEILGDLNTEMSLRVALDQIPADRVTPGMILRFRETGKGWTEYMLTGEKWYNTESWTPLGNSMDGGTL